MRKYQGGLKADDGFSELNCEVSDAVVDIGNFIS